MPEQEPTNNGIQATDVPGLSFRGFQGEADYPHIQTIIAESNQVDGIAERMLPENIEGWCAPFDHFDPHHDLLFALDGSARGEAPSVVGLSRLGWYSGLENVRLYYQISFLLPSWRGRGVWRAMVRRNERRLQEIAAGHPPTTQRLLQAWSTDKQAQWISVLESKGYQTVRRFFNMLHQLEAIPERPLPAGLEIRPAQPDHYRSIWEVQKEAYEGLFETVAENWTEEKYQAWRVSSSHTPHLWQVAWDGDQVAGMVLNRIDETENRERGRKRGYTEHIFVRRPWQQRGLASALIAQSLQLLKAQGMNEAELGVDSENESAALRLYQRMGYQTFSIDTWFRKSME